MIEIVAIVATVITAVEDTFVATAAKAAVLPAAAGNIVAVVEPVPGEAVTAVVAQRFAGASVPWFRLHGWGHDEDPAVGDAAEVVHFIDGSIAVGRPGTFSI